jgi:peptidyl-dipeptidase Dcp
MTSPNPLLAPWATPFGLPPFDRIAPEHFAAAVEQGMAEHRAEVAAIAENPADPSFANTIEALERSGRTLRRVSALFSNLVASLGGEALEQLDTALSPQLARHWTQIALNPGLFQRVAALFGQRESVNLAEDQSRLLQRIHLNLVRRGAALAPAAKARMAEILERLAVLQTKFGQNVLHDEREWTLPLSQTDLEGLPGFVIEGAVQAAAERGMQGYVITLSRSIIEPFLTFSKRRDLRQLAHAAWIARGAHAGPHDNRVLIPEILSLRAERARLLGYQNFADLQLADTMAGTAEAVQDLLGEVWQPAVQKAAAERDRLLAAARAEGMNDALQAWDWRYYAEKVRASDYAIDESEVKSYFTLENLQWAAFDTANRLFGLRFFPLPEAPVYHPDVQVYEVRDGEKHLGLFLTDHYARRDKRSGAWMSSFRDQEGLDEAVTPIIINNNNFVKSAPTLLSFDDARTLFHEFGHALHGLLSQVRYPSQSGTSVRQDFVELPSQIYEHWAELPEILRAYARHYETGAALPDALIDRLLAARGFNQGFGTIEYTAAALIDMALHSDPVPERLDVDAFEQEFLARIGMPAEIALRHRPAHFQHLFSGDGYAAGYYSYLWSEVLDEDGFDAFRQAGDPFDKEIAARLKHLLSAGDTSDPMALYVAFRGHPPSTAALLRGRGLVTA